jgi:hypothetical protein
MEIRKYVDNNTMNNSIPYSLFPIPYSLFPIPYSLFTVCWKLLFFPVRICSCSLDFKHSPEGP